MARRCSGRLVAAAFREPAAFRQMLRFRAGSRSRADTIPTARRARRGAPDGITISLKIRGVLLGTGFQSVIVKGWARFIYADGELLWT